MPDNVLTKVAILAATAGHVGFVPFAPGTFGSIVGLGIYAAVRASDSVLVEAVVLLLTVIVGVWSAGRVERVMGKDPSAVVIDEVAGMLFTLALVNVTIVGAVVGFLLFRWLDVWKPFPAARLEHLHGGPGIMLDDVVAGVYSNLALRGLSLLFPGTLA